MMASISLVFCVQSRLLSLFLIMFQRFSIGFRSGELPGHASVLIPLSVKFRNFLRRMAWRKVLLKYSITSGVILLELRPHFVPQYFDIFLGIHHSINRLECSRSINIKAPPKHFLFRVFHMLLYMSRPKWFPNRASNVLCTLPSYFKMGLVGENHFAPVFLAPVLVRLGPLQALLLHCGRQ